MPCSNPAGCPCSAPISEGQLIYQEICDTIRSYKEAELSPVKLFTCTFSQSQDLIQFLLQNSGKPFDETIKSDSHGSYVVVAGVPVFALPWETMLRPWSKESVRDLKGMFSRKV